MIISKQPQRHPCPTTTFPAPAASRCTAAKKLNTPAGPRTSLSSILLPSTVARLLQGQPLPFSSHNPQPFASNGSASWCVPEAGLPVRPTVPTGSVQHLSATKKALNKGFLVDERPWFCKDTGCGPWLTPLSGHGEGLSGGVPACGWAVITVHVAQPMQAWLSWGHSGRHLSASFPCVIFT